jgi:hypothetical protein
LGGGELGFEAVAEGHQLVDLGDDAVLLGEGRGGIGGTTNEIPGCDPG